MTYRQTEQPTLYHAHAQRYLREANGDKRKARRACIADRDAHPDKAFFNLVLKLIGGE